MNKLLIQAQSQGMRNFYLIMVVFSLLITGCADGGKPPYAVENYLLNYPASSRGSLGKLDTSIKFNRFSIATAYNSVNMIFSDDPYRFDAFNYSRWAVNPADMIADGLLRDFRESGFFQAIFSRYESDEGRFVISGRVEEFFMRIEKGDKKAVVSMVVSLKDTRQQEADKRLIFQKKYVREEPLQESSPRGYCQAASQSMRIISEQIISDIYTAIKTNIQSTKGNP